MEWTRCACCCARQPRHLTPAGVLVVEVGNTETRVRRAVSAAAVHVAEFERGGGGVFLLTAEQLRRGAPVTEGALVCQATVSAGRSSSRTFGESHGPALGCIVDGCPPGLALTEADLQADVDRRRTGTSQFVSQRKEGDAVRILSGVFEGVTTGTPIGLLIENTDARSRDYEKIKDRFRPGHADYTYQQKYGLRDYRGGGRSSARETVMRVAAGAIARKYLADTPRRTHQRLCEPGGRPRDRAGGSGGGLRQSVLLSRILRASRSSRTTSGSCAARAIRWARRSRVIANGVPPGLGEPVFDRLDADIAHAMMSINAVKAVEIGDGVAAAAQRGSEHRDELTPDGLPLQPRRRHPRRHFLRPGRDRARDAEAHFQHPGAGRTIDVAGDPVEVITTGRHDPCVGLRATPIAEAMLALMLMDHYLRHRAQNADVRSTTPVI